MNDNKSKFFRFSGLGVQMGAIIGLFTWLGSYIDKKQGNDTKGWTLGLALFGVIGAMYLIIKGIKKMNND